MTKNISSSKGHNSRGSSSKAVVTADKKQTQQHSNVTNHTQATAVIISVQKASIDLKMLTPEQRRLASLMNDKVDVSEIEKKINKIMELTGASKDKAIVALHDCANELDKAIDMILEGDSINESEWKSQARKKKPKVLPGASDTSVNLNGDSKKGGKGRREPGRGKQQTNPQQTDKSSFGSQSTNRPDRRPPRGEWKPREQRENSSNDNTESVTNKQTVTEFEIDDKLDEWADDTTTSVPATTTTAAAQSQSNREGREHSQRPPRRERDFEGRPPYSSNKYQNSTQEGRRINSGPRGPGGYAGRGNSSSNQFGASGDRRDRREQNDRGMSERRPYQGKGYGIKKPGYTNSIDTWSNLTATTDNTTPNNDYASMTVGNWSDVVSSNSAAVAVQPQTSDLNNEDEWTEASENASNLIEQATNKVFSKDNQTNKTDDQLPKIKMPNLASIVSGVKPVTQQQQPPQQQQPSTQQQNVHKSPQQSKQQQILSTSNNQTQSLLNKSPQQQQQPRPQRQPQQQTNQQSQQNKIDLAALLKSSQNSSQQQPTSGLIRGNIQQQQQRTNQPDTNTYGAALLQHLQQRIVTSDQDTSSLASKASANAASTNLNDYVHPYGNQSNKNIVTHNIPSSTNYSSSQQNASSNLFDNQSHHLHHSNVADQKALSNQQKRRQTKIPETAVEMPTSEHISSLNVQFGALDFGTTAETYGLNDDQITSKQSQFNLSTRDASEKSINTTSLLGTVRGQQSNESNKSQPQTQQNAKDSLLQNIDHHASHHQLQDNILHQQHTDPRNKSQQQQQQSAAAGQGYSHLNAYGNKNDSSSNQHSSIYQPNLQNYHHQSSYGSSVGNYGSQQQNSSQHSNSVSNAGQNVNQQQQQKINLKDLTDNSQSSNQNNAPNNASSSNSALGNLVNNTTVTTNVLKNSLTATGKNTTGNNMQQQLGVAPNVAPLLGTPQYIMSQPALSTFYPVYDVPMAADHSFRYNQNTQDVKYNRPVDAQDSQVGQSNPHGPNQVQSTQAPVTQTPNHQIFSQFPPYFFYTGVNMMTQGLYQTPFLPVQPNPASGQGVNQPPHAPNSNQQHSTGFGPKGAQNQAAYSASYASSTGYDPITGHQLTQGGQDFVKQNYSSGPPNSNQNANQQSGKQHSQMSSGGSNDLVNNIYNKSHAQLTKNFEKSNAFQTGTPPPPFGIATLGTLGYNPNQFIPMMQPQSNPSMLHHTLQGDANQNNSGVAGQVRGSQAQKNSASNSKNYYNWS